MEGVEIRRSGLATRMGGVLKSPLGGKVCEIEVISIQLTLMPLCLLCPGPACAYCHVIMPRDYVEKYSIEPPFPDEVKRFANYEFQSEIMET